MAEGRQHEAPRRGSALGPVARTFLAAGVLTFLLGSAAALARAPEALAPYGAPLAVGGAVAMVVGLLFSGASALEQRLIEAELALIETRQQLKAAVEALHEAPARSGKAPAFRSRPVRSRARRQA